jgi:TolC family type I secretion outer membrane protein
MLILVELGLALRIIKEKSMPKADSVCWFFSCARVFLAMVALGFTSCVQNLPELNPMKYASPDPGEEWKPSPEQVNAPLPSEKLPGIPPDLEPYASKFNLSQLVDIALRESPETRQAWELARAAAAEWASARGSYYPTITGTGTFGEGKGGQTQGVGSFREDLAQGSLALNYLLLDFGGRSATVEAARQALINANWNHNQSIQDVLRDVATAYYTLLGNKAQLKADETSLEDAETSLEAAELQLRVGVGTIVDVYQAQASLAQVKLDLVSDRGAVEISRGQLATVIGLPANTPFDIADEPQELPLSAISQNVDELIKLAKEQRPALAAARAAVRQSEAELRQAESAQWPQLIASAQVSPLVAREEGNTDYATNYFAGVQLQIPIFEGFSLTNAVRAARAELEASRSALVLEEEAVISEVWTAYYNFRTAAEQLQASEVLLASAKESFDASLTRYRSGVGDIIELLNAQTVLAEARAELVQARTSLYTSYAELIRAIGEELQVAQSQGAPAPANDQGEKRDEGK